MWGGGGLMTDFGHDDLNRMFFGMVTLKVVEMNSSVLIERCSHIYN